MTGFIKSFLYGESLEVHVFISEGSLMVILDCLGGRRHAEDRDKELQGQGRVRQSEDGHQTHEGGTQSHRQEPPTQGEQPFTSL